MHKKTTNGFTLIELLVVVLIIGILAAVALPQYNKAVYKARNTQLKTLAKSVGQARDSFRTANGDYPTTFDQLDIDVPFESSGYVCAMAPSTDTKRGTDFAIMLSEAHHVVALWTGGKYACCGMRYSTSRKLQCVERENAVNPGDFCEKIEKGTLATTSDSFRYYDLP